ncbi:MAG: BREX-1 system phosphatase PglZ type A [Erysipelotrichaceae bacterium]|nr:BREX-1 system phosphatase PglZ type A [Erysipelotrichaceae bacterium]
MDLEDIIEDLNRRFSLPLKEYYKRRIIFWNDEKRENEDIIDQIELENAKIVKLTGANNFEIKKLINVDDTESNYLIYNPLVINNLKNDWFLDVKLYSEEFRSDRTSRWMNSLNIPQLLELRKRVEQYQGFFNSESRRNAFVSYNYSITKPVEIDMVILSTLCKTRKVSTKEIIKAVLSDSLDFDNKYMKSFLKYGASTTFWEIVRRTVGYDEEKQSIEQLANHIVINASFRTLNEKLLKGLERYYDNVSEEQENFCYELIDEWLHSNQMQDAREIIRVVEDKLELYTRFDKAEINELLENNLFECVDELILRNSMFDIYNNNYIDSNNIRRIVDARKSKIYYSTYENYYKGLLEIANMADFHQKYNDEFHETDANELWNNYIDHYYLMDTYYRHFMLCYHNILMNSNDALDDSFKELVEYVDKDYKNWYLYKLDSKWYDLIEEPLKESGRINGVDYQEDFYKNYVSNNKVRTYVIISDGLRYEVATSLVEELKQDFQADVKINAQQSIFPADTEYGMPALLPHKQLTIKNVNGKIQVLADGQSTDSSNRQNVLQKYDEASVALKFNDVVNMTRAERNNAIQGKNIVYIYHDCIDNTGHKDTDSTFEACDKTINDIKNLIQILVNNFTAKNILITADHGFLYNNSPLTEVDKLDKSDFRKDIVISDKRYVLTDKKVGIDFLVNVKGIYNEYGYEGYATKGSIRIKKQGGQNNYVHGGLSLQEMVVPVVKFTNVRSNSKTYMRNKKRYDTKPVEIELVNQSRTIRNKIYNLSFYQKDPVSTNNTACTYEAYMVDTKDNVVSDIQRIVADNTSKDNKDREIKCTFNLKSLTFSNLDAYYLVIVDEKHLQAPKKIEFTIDILVSTDEFDFFS